MNVAAHIITKARIIACTLIVCVSFSTNAQISPGALTNAHAQFEGIANCTKCHVLGDKVTNDKCLECHKEIKTRIDQRRGYHSSSEVTGKDCFACHSEHHGRNFEIIRFDEEHFNHQLTGYKLTGAHMEQDCRACHQPENIVSPEFRKNKDTYLGLSTDCKSCHQDVHQNTLGNNCASCHNTAVFKPAALFDHAKTEFPLRGQHRNVDCASCHQVVVQNDQLFQKFSGIAFNSCVDCHDDAHDSRLGNNCKACHTEESFQTFIGKSSFNHQQTDFPLLGKHKQVNCASCHQLDGQTNAANVFADHRGKDFHNCVACHEDVHDSKFGTDCKQCHTEESFFKIKNLDKFDHNRTEFPLLGKHAAVDCKQCHETRLTDPVAHTNCMDCHEDFHEGQFVSINTTPVDCKACHNVEGFQPSLFTIEKHNEGPFPLTGAHLATPCASCHLQEKEWTFRNIGSACIDCHQDIHKGFLSQQYYPDNACTSCHSTEAWTSVSFEHDDTGFALEGKHEVISCTACHQPEVEEVSTSHLAFTGLETNCVSCHENIHGSQFEAAGGGTDCRQCHGFEAWKPAMFDHNNARFKLDGAHINLSCNQCHFEEVGLDGVQRTNYRSGKLECVDCHL